MATYSVTDGVAKWSAGALVSTADITTYATARDWTDWATASSAARDAVGLDASTWVRATWSPPKAYDEETDAAIADAICEAARLALGGALLGGETAGERIKIREKIGPLEDEWAPTSREKLRSERLALVAAMLRAAGAASRTGPGLRIYRS